MDKSTNPGTWVAFAIFLTILGGTIAPATVINVDGDSAGNDLVSPGQIWRYFKGTEPPGNPAQAWTAIDFDDSSWQTGPAGFGFGDNDDATVLDDMRGNYLSVYIRKEFSASSLSPDDVITLEIDYDDGFIAYLNGSEIARAHMDGENVAYDSTAASAHEAGSSETFVLGTVAELLNEGINVLAIEGHNVSLSSSDFSLIPTLRTASNVTRIGETWVVETETVTLKFDIINSITASILVDGTKADFNTDDCNWSIDISLLPGVNNITIEYLDLNTNVIDSRTVEIRYVVEINNVAGELTENTTWSGICVVEDTVVVPAGIVLKIEPGTIVRMKDAARLIVYGQLTADGTESNPIQFTRYSNGMSWKQIMFIEAADSQLSHCIFEYADSEGEHQDYYVPGPRNYHEAIVALACHLDIENCIFRNLPDESGGANGDALAIIADDQDHPGKASANIRGCEFLSIGQGVHTRFSYVLVEDCYFTGKRGDNDDVDLWGESTPAPLIQNNLFLNPEHDDMINPTRCSAVIVGNIIAGSDDHGVVLRDKCSPVMMNNLIFDCSSAGVAVENSCEATLINNTIVDCGRGVRLLDLGRWGPPYSLNPGGGTATIINCIIWDCPQPITLADSSNTQIEDRGSHVTVKYSDIEGGQNGISVSGSHSTFTWKEGNIDADPQFAAVNNGDYHLKSQAGRWEASGESWVVDNVTSPCIDAGDPSSPVAFEPSPNGANVNMGTYGGTPEASKSPSGLNAKYGGGTGVPNDPYLIYTAQHLNNISTEPNDWGKHFKLMADIDLTGYSYNQALIAPDIDTDEYYFQGIRYVGIFDGNHHTISNLTLTGVSYLGLFGELGFGATVKDLGVVDVNISGSGDAAGGLLGHSREGANIIRCYSTGKVNGDDDIGGLVGINGGYMTQCYSICTVSGNYIIGGLLGANEGQAIVANCYSTGAVNGDDAVGGLVGFNLGEATHCYCAGAVTADQRVGGLVGWIYGNIVSSFWDIDTSDQADMCGSQEEGASGCDDSFGLTTIEMQMVGTFLDAGWDFVDETDNGAEDIWWIIEGQDYPRLSWELSD